MVRTKASGGFRSAINCLAVGGRLVEIAATGQREVSFDLVDFYRNESRLFGVNTLNRDITASAEVLDALTPGFVAGDYRAAPIAETCGLGKAQEAYRKVAAKRPEFARRAMAQTRAVLALIRQSVRASA